MNDAAPRKPRITRAEAAKLLGTSYQNVRRLQRTGQLLSNPDRYGVHRFDRREVEALARRRGLQIRPSGELAAKVFAMFKARVSFVDVVIETQQEPEFIRKLWSEYRAGFEVDVATDDDAAASHLSEMSVLDHDLEEKRRGLR
ncbi:MAG: hypothetical protein ABI551_19775 [Polyangiaceae bacterium]